MRWLNNRQWSRLYAGIALAVGGCILNPQPEDASNLEPGTSGGGSVMSTGGRGPEVGNGGSMALGGASASANGGMMGLGGTLAGAAAGAINGAGLAGIAGKSAGAAGAAGAAGSIAVQAAAGTGSGRTFAGAAGVHEPFQGSGGSAGAAGSLLP